MSLSAWSSKLLVRDLTDRCFLIGGLSLDPERAGARAWPDSEGGTVGDAREPSDGASSNEEDDDVDGESAELRFGDAAVVVMWCCPCTAPDMPCASRAYLRQVDTKRGQGGVRVGAVAATQRRWQHGTGEPRLCRLLSSLLIRSIGRSVSRLRSLAPDLVFPSVDAPADQMGRLAVV